MSKTTIALSLGVVMAGSFLSGCSHTTADGTTVTTSPGGTMTVTDKSGNTATVTGNGKDITVQSKDGTSTMHADANGYTATNSKGETVNVGGGVTEQDLGVPFYPGSTEVPNGGMKATTSQGNEALSSRTTTDDPSKVVAFYTEKLGKPESNFSSSDVTMATWKSGKNSTVLQIGKGDAPGSYKISLTVSNPK